MRKTIMTILILFFGLNLIYADYDVNDVNDVNDVKKLKEQYTLLKGWSQQKTQRIKKLEKKISELENEINVIKKENERLINLCKKNNIYYGIENNKVNINFRKTVDINDIGYITEAKIFGIVNKNEMVVNLKRKEFRVPKEGGYTKLKGGGAKVLGRYEAAYGAMPKMVNTPADYIYDEVYFCIKGLNTNIYADGQEIKLNRIFKLTGTEKIRGITVFVLNPIE